MRTAGFETLRNERGSVVLVGLMVLVLLTIIGIAATTTTTTHIQIAGNQKIHNMAFYAADAGIEVGRAALNDLKEDDSGNWDNLLKSPAQQLVGQATGTTTLDQVIDGAGGRTVGPPQCTYTLQVRDNDDLDGNPLVDTDDIVILTSTGRHVTAPGRMTQVQIETQVRYTAGGGQYAQEHFGTDSSGAAAGESGAVAAQKRW